MAKKRRFFAVAYIEKPKRRRKGIHSKNRNTNQKNGKYYTGTKYRGQGRRNLFRCKEP